MKFICYSINLLTSFYIHLGHSAKFFNTALKTFVLNSNYYGSSIINLYYTMAFTKTALNYCSNILAKNNIILFILSNPFSYKFYNLKTKNSFFWLEKWKRGFLSNFKTSNIDIYLNKKLPNFVIFVDSVNKDKEAIAMEANYVGIFSFGFVQTQSNLKKLNYWAPGNNKTEKSCRLYYNLIKTIVAKSKILKTKKFLKI